MIDGMTTDQAIARSVSHTEIVHLPYSLADESALMAACEDSADAGDRVEFWGKTEHGAEWRIHLDRISPEEIAELEADYADMT